MKLVIKGPFTALRVNRTLVGLPRYLPSSRMWFEKIEFKGVRWSLINGWPAGAGAESRRSLREGAGAGGAAVQGRGLLREKGSREELGSERVRATSAEGQVPSLPPLVSGPGLAMPQLSPQFGAVGPEQSEAAGPVRRSVP